MLYTITYFTISFLQHEQIVLNLTENSSHDMIFFLQKNNNNNKKTKQHIINKTLLIVNITSFL